MALALAPERGDENSVEILVASVACFDLRHGHGRELIVWSPNETGMLLAKALQRKLASRRANSDR